MSARSRKERRAYKKAHPGPSRKGKGARRARIRFDRKMAKIAARAMKK